MSFAQVHIAALGTAVSSRILATHTKGYAEIGGDALVGPVGGVAGALVIGRQPYPITLDKLLEGLPRIA